jgi:hypothetical protein
MPKRSTRRPNGSGTLYLPHATADFWCRTRRVGTYLKKGGPRYVYLNLRTNNRQEAQALLDSDVVQAALRRLRQH